MKRKEKTEALVILVGVVLVFLALTLAIHFTPAKGDDGYILIESGPQWGVADLLNNCCPLAQPLLQDNMSFGTDPAKRFEKLEQMRQEMG